MNKSLLKKRDKHSHKGDFGKILVVAGSKGMAGAALMCGKAALKSGVGLVRFAVPEELFTILQIGLPEAVCIERDFENKINLKDYEAVAFGSGLGVSEENSSITKKILREYKGKIVIDADGLNTIRKYSLDEELQKSEADIVITPHLGEAARLLEVDKVKIEERLCAAEKLSSKFGVTVVMKGAETIVLNHEQSYVNTTGNPGMATGGSGDVLTGIIASLCAQGYDTFEAAKIGVYIHGLAGDICADEIGQTGMTAMDIVEKVPSAFQILNNK
ncbi:MAG: NAD(P)H-hydrate dehydratase [Eubacterium sp.]|nr:NAD(P)H-hydrate dehydratase [Eubacterium sp.]